MELQRCIGHRPMVRRERGHRRVVAGSCRVAGLPRVRRVTRCAHDAHRRGPARPGGHGRPDRGRRDRPRRGPGHGVRAGAARRPPVRRAQRLRAGARRDPDLPAAAAAARGARRAARPGEPADGAGRARHARADGGGGAGRPPRLRAGPARGDLSRHHGGQPRVVEARDVRRPRHRPGRPDRGAVRGPDGPGGAGAAQPRGRRARRRAGARPGAAARGRRDLRRQQVLLPRRRRPEDHRRVALAGRADHLGARSSAPPGSPRCGR